MQACSSACSSRGSARSISTTSNDPSTSHSFSSPWACSRCSDWRRVDAYGRSLLGARAHPFARSGR